MIWNLVAHQHGEEPFDSKLAGAVFQEGPAETGGAIFLVEIQQGFDGINVGVGLAARPVGRDCCRVLRNKSRARKSRISSQVLAQVWLNRLRSVGVWSINLRNSTAVWHCQQTTINEVDSSGSTNPLEFPIAIMLPTQQRRYRPVRNFTTRSAIRVVGISD